MSYASTEVFHEVLGQEVYVDIDRLKDLAQHGIPDEVRGEVWKYLLGVSQPDKSQEVTTNLARSQEYNDQKKRDLHNSNELQQMGNSRAVVDDDDDVVPMKRVRGEIKRYQESAEQLQNLALQKGFEKVVSGFLTQNPHLAEYYTFIIPLCGPLVAVYRDNEPEIYHTFSSLMKMTRDRLLPATSNKLIADFMAVFRITQPELYSHFEQEELEPNEWAIPWIQSLLSRELPLDCVLRLWDSYFAQDNGFELHPYVCLSILANCKETLEELEYADLLGYLQHLPWMDMDTIIAQAQNIRHDALAHNLL